MKETNIEIGAKPATSHVGVMSQLAPTIHVQVSTTFHFNMSYEEIPIEIRIFLLLCEYPIAIHALDNRLRFDGFPWAVGQVSRRWREVFLSYPHLWTSLSLHDAGVDAYLDSFAEMNRRTTLYLERSGQLPLTITVSVHSTEIKQFPRAAWRSLLSCSNRWKMAYLFMGHERSTIDDLLECRNQISMLESMDLSMLATMDEFETLDSAFAVAPRLTELKLEHVGQNYRWVFPWSQLKKLRIAIILNEAVLSQLQNVEVLRFLSHYGSRLPNFDTGARRPPMITPRSLSHVHIPLCVLVSGLNDADNHPLLRLGKTVTRQVRQRQGEGYVNRDHLHLGRQSQG